MMSVLDENLYWRISGDRAPTGEVILHCTIKKWTHNVYKYLMGQVCQLQMMIKEPLYAPWVSEKQEKFMAMLGFYPTEKYMVGIDQNVYQLFKFEVH